MEGGPSLSRKRQGGDFGWIPAAELLLRRLLIIRLGRILLPRRRFFNLFPVVDNLGARTKPLVVLVVKDFANTDVTRREVQRVIRQRVGREPVLAVDLFPPSGEAGEEIFLTLLLANVGHGFPTRLHDLKILIIHPDAALEIALSFFNLLRRNIENVSVQIVLLLLAHIKNVVFA